MGIMNNIKLNKLLSKIKKADKLTNEQIKLLSEVKTYNDRLLVIKKCPFVFPYMIKHWNDNKSELDELAYAAVEYLPDNITKLGKGSIVPNEELVEMAMVSDPMVVFKFDDNLKSFISQELFLSCFAINPLILLADLDILKSKIVRRVNVSTKDGIVEKVLKSTVRTECLKAIRLAEKVSRYHPGYDDFALSIAKEIATSSLFSKNKSKEEMIVKIPTVVNAMIKKQDQNLRACPVTTWKLNNNKTLYAALRESVKADSELEGLLGDIPTKLLPVKVAKKAVAVAITGDPEVYTKLDEYGLGAWRNDAYIKYVAYKSCQKHKRMDIIEAEFNEKDIKIADSKYRADKTRKANAKAKKQNKTTQEKQNDLSL